MLRRVHLIMQKLTLWLRYARRNKATVILSIFVLFLVVIAGLEMQSAEFLGSAGTELGVAHTQGDFHLLENSHQLLGEDFAHIFAQTNGSIGDLTIQLQNNIKELSKMRADVEKLNEIEVQRIRIEKEKHFDSKNTTKPSKLLWDIPEKCGFYKADRPNWTIYYKSDVTTGCLKKWKWIKKIVFSNGTIVYQGCTKRTHRCGVSPYFDNKLNMRINMRPCCLEKIISIFRDVSKALISNDVGHFLFGGGLIGWFRNKSIVPYDHDLDVLIDLKFWSSSKFDKWLRSLTRNHGYFVRKLSWNKIKVYYNRVNRNFVDMWPYQVHEDHIRIKSSLWKRQPVTNILPLKRDYFEGFEVSVPSQPEAALDLEYGKGNWKSELTCKKKGKFGNCIT